MDIRGAGRRIAGPEAGQSTVRTEPQSLVIIDQYSEDGAVRQTLFGTEVIELLCFGIEPEQATVPGADPEFSVSIDEDDMTPENFDSVIRLEGYLKVKREEAA